MPKCLRRAIIATLAVAGCSYVAVGCGHAAPTDDLEPVRSATSACDPAVASPSALEMLKAYLGGALVRAEPTGPGPAATEVVRERGEALYMMHCASCHGKTGDGTGPLATQLAEAPAVLATGTFELRSTEHEALPTDADLFRTISRGIHGTGMPPWFALPESDRWALVVFVKTLSKQFQEDSPPPPIEVGDAPAVTPERIAHGKAVFASGGCASCHGTEGRGDGPAATALRYPNGQIAKPRDLTRAQYHRGNDLPELYLTLAAGLDGTPMATFAKVLPPNDLWDVAMYVHSIGPRYTARPNGLRCPPTADTSPDEQIGVRSLMRTLHPGH